MIMISQIDQFKDAAVALFKPHIDEGAPGLVDVLRRSVDYVHVDQKKGELVIDRRAIFLATLSVGLDLSRSQFPNMANWFADWLKDRLVGVDIEKALHKGRVAPGRLDQTGRRWTLVVSESLRKILPTAADYALRTVKRPKAALRHFFLAVLTDRDHAVSISDLNWKLAAKDRENLAVHLFQNIGAGLQKGEDLNAWLVIVAHIHAVRLQPVPPPPEPVPPSPAPIPPSPPPPPVPSPALLLSGFAADAANGEDGADPLDISADVVAMARLICHGDADTPISIGIFGGWGSGKSTFMARLQQQVRKLSGPDAARPEPGEPRFVSPVVQIRFNAWQFADANLWASLTAEFFDQLRAGGFEGKGQRIHARLIQDVNQHVRGLSADAAKNRAALLEADEKLRDAKAKHDAALQAKNNAVAQALVSELADAYRDNRGGLIRAGLLPPGAAELEAFVALAEEANSQGGQFKLIWRVLKAHWTVVTVVLGVTALGVALLWNQGVARLIPVAAGLISTGWAVLRTTKPILDQLSPLAARLRGADTKALKVVLEKEIALRKAEDEVAALRESSERADRALARYIDPQARSNPPRVLRYLLEDDPETKAFERQIGLMGRARRLFESLDEIVEDRRAKLRKQAGAAAQSEPAADGETMSEDVPERIILYIDDLDRCTHEQVYKVLQAVHLLLAFRLFVVIVAVDVKWVEGAVARHLELGGAIGTGAVDETVKRARAIEYLSKIFQLPFWLRPFAGKDDARFANYVHSLAAKQKPAAVPASPPADPQLSQGEAAVLVDPERSSQGSDGPAVAPDPEPDDPQEDPLVVADALRSMELDPLEVAFLASPAIAAIASSDPRGVKRLVNVYKIARARLSEVDEGMILGDASRAPAYPLIALIAAIETGQSTVVADTFLSSLKDQANADGLLTDSYPNGWAGHSKALIAAFEAVDAERDGHVATRREALTVAKIVRRYSFNKFH